MIRSSRHILDISLRFRSLSWLISFLMESDGRMHRLLILSRLIIGIRDATSRLNWTLGKSFRLYTYIVCLILVPGCQTDHVARSLGKPRFLHDLCAVYQPWLGVTGREGQVYVSKTSTAANDDVDIANDRRRPTQSTFVLQILLGSS